MNRRIPKALGAGRRILPALAVILLLAGCKSEPGREAPAPSREPPSATGSAVSPAGDGRPVIVAFGDSLTAGLGVGPSESYPGRLQAMLDEEGYSYRVVNAGVSGDTTAQGVNRLESIRELRPFLVVLALGANDGLRGLPVETTRKNLETIITRLQDDGTKVVLAGMRMPPNYGPFFTRPFEAIYPELARKYRIPLIFFLLDGVAGIPDLNQADGIHPNARGYAIVLENVWKTLKKEL